jgi:pimeloyl-ACP methyl ester carboxylesterase
MPFAEVNHVKLHYHKLGKGPTVVFIAGLGVDNMCWLFQVPEFQKYFTVIVFDNRGIGKSTGSFGPYSIKLMANDVADLLSFLDIKKAHIVGTSMGGMIAQEVALQHSDKVDRLVLCSTFAKPAHIIDLLSRGLKDLLEETVQDIFEINPRRFVFERLFNYLLSQVFTGEFLQLHKPLIEDSLRKYISRVTYAETFLKQVQAVFRHNTINRLPNIKAETLILSGTRDKLIPQECSNILSQYIPHSTLYTIENGSHGVHFEQFDEFNKIIIHFLLDDDAE